METNHQTEHTIAQGEAAEMPNQNQAKKPSAKLAVIKEASATKSQTSVKKTKPQTVKKDVKKSTAKTKSEASGKKIVAKIDPKTGTVKVLPKKTTSEKTSKMSQTPKDGSGKASVVSPAEKAPVLNPKIQKIPVKTIEPAPRPTTSPVIVRPTPKKPKVLNKEEKAQYKKLQESFDFIANLTWVIEERTMDTKNIPDLTLGELHVIEMVNRYNNKPMTIIANKLKVTVGAFTTCVNRLVQKEYLLRTRDEMDHRVILLSITSKGKKVLKFHDKFHDDILGLALEGVSLAQATKVMTQFADVLEYYYNPVEPKEIKEKKKK